MTDGANGFAKSWRLLAARPFVKTIDSAHRPSSARWWSGSKTAIIESATAIGLARLPGG